jgi:hypothetical protein
MAAWPSRIAMSEALPRPGGEKVIERPVGNSPGPETMERVTAGLSFTRAPEASSRVTTSWTSSVPSAAARVLLSAASVTRAALPSTGQAGAGAPA